LSDSHEKYIELMHADIDGAASKEQMAALEEYLATHPEAQRARAELKKLTEVLSQVEPIESPADLRKNIMAEVRRRHSVLDFGLGNRRARLQIPLIRYGYALAAGVLLGVVLTGVASKSLSPVEKSDVYGTMMSPKNAGHYVVAEQMKLAAPGLAGSVELSRSGDNEMIVFDLSSGQPAEVELRFDGGQVGLKGFSQEPNNIRSFDAKQGSISFRSEGRQSSTVILASDHRARLPLNVRFYVGGKLVHEATVGATAPRGSSK